MLGAEGVIITERKGKMSRKTPRRTASLARDACQILPSLEGQVKSAERRGNPEMLMSFPLHRESGGVGASSGSESGRQRQGEEKGGRGDFTAHSEGILF